MWTYRCSSTSSATELLHDLPTSNYSMRAVLRKIAFSIYNKKLSTKTNLHVNLTLLHPIGGIAMKAAKVDILYVGLSVGYVENGKKTTRNDLVKIVAVNNEETFAK